MLIDPNRGIDFDNFVVVEEGDYLMRVGSVTKNESTPDRVAWMLRMELVEGPLAGRTAVTDWLNFTDRGMHRVRLILDVLGFDVSRAIDVEADDLVGRVARLRITTEETTRPRDGRVQCRSRVPYDGWSPGEDPNGEWGGSLSGDGPAGSDHSLGASPDSRGGGAGTTIAADAMPF